MASFAANSLAALSQNLLLVRWGGDSTLNLSLCSSRTDEFFPKFIGSIVSSENGLMKLRAIVSAFAIFSNNWSIVAISRFWSRILCRNIHCSLVKQMLKQCLLIYWCWIHVWISFVSWLLSRDWRIHIIWYKILDHWSNRLSLLAWVVRYNTQAFHWWSNIFRVCLWLVTPANNANRWVITAMMMLLLNSIVACRYYNWLILSSNSAIYLWSYIGSRLVLAYNRNVMRFLSAVATWGWCQLGRTTLVLSTRCMGIVKKDKIFIVILDSYVILLDNIIGIVASNYLWVVASNSLTVIVFWNFLSCRSLQVWFSIFTLSWFLHSRGFLLNLLRSFPYMLLVYIRAKVVVASRFPRGCSSCPIICFFMHKWLGLCKIVLTLFAGMSSNYFRITCDNLSCILDKTLLMLATLSGSSIVQSRAVPSTSVGK